MGKTYKANEYESFETTGYLENKHHYFEDMNGNRRSDSKIGITTSMMLHPAYLDLTAQQRNLYLIAKYQYHNAPDMPCKHNENDLYKGRTGKRYIYLNRKLAEVFHVYSDGKNNKSFYRDITALVEHGFIVPIERENNQRTIYLLSDEWKNYIPGMKYTEINKNLHRWEWVRVEY